MRKRIAFVIIRGRKYVDINILGKKISEAIFESFLRDRPCAIL